MGRDASINGQRAPSARLDRDYDVAETQTLVDRDEPDEDEPDEDRMGSLFEG